MIKELDWQMMGFVGMSLFQEIWLYHHLPKVYYWDVKNQKEKNDQSKKSA